MQGLQLGCGSLLVGELILAKAVVEQTPQTAQELMHTVDTVGIPRLRLLQRTEEHLVHTQRIGAVCLNDIVGIHDVEHRLRHLLDRPAADILAVLQDELGINELGTPLAEGLQVEHIVANDIHIDVDLLRFVLIAQTERHKLIGAHHAINEVRATLNHTLVNQLLEGLVLANIAQVVEEHIPETRVHQVTRSVLDTTHIEIDIAPILVSLAAHQSL